MNCQNPDLIILYGSETGTTQDLALTLANRCRYLSLNPLVCAMDSLNLEKLFDVSTILILCSTTGQGDYPRNCKKFTKFLMRKNLPSNFLEHLHFSTCGLGDSSYVFYNKAIRKIHARLKQLGAKELCDRVECDEQSSEGQEAFYDAWEKLVINALKKNFNKMKEISETVILDPIYKITMNENSFKKDISTISTIDRVGINDVFPVELAKLTKLTSDDHFQEVYNILLKDPKENLKYQIGDTIALYPANQASDVTSFINLQGFQSIADYPINLDYPKHLVPDGGWVKNLTLRSLITYHLDIMAVPPRSFFKNAWHFATDEREIEKLQELSKIEESEQLYNYVNRPHRSCLEVIQEFFSLKVPFNQLLELIPLIKPRLFSITNLPRSTDAELTVAIVEYTTIIRRVRKGLCTNWLKFLKVGDTISISIINNNLKLPNSDMILVGPGTGIAPIRSIIQYNNSLSDSERHEYLLFTGHRFKSKDYLYGDEWPLMKGLTVIDSFSREGGGYVQDTIWKNKDKVAKIINNGGGIYICGSSGKMPTQVRITIQEILKVSNNWDDETAKQEMLKLETAKRYIQETW